jgi:hypothetical protein
MTGTSTHLMVSGDALSELKASFEEVGEQRLAAGSRSSGIGNGSDDLMRYRPSPSSRPPPAHAH